MVTVRRGTSQYVSTSVSTTHNVPLPAGSQVGDWVILGASNQAFAATFTLPGTTILEAGNNTLRYGLCTKQLSSGDITAGYLTVGIGSAQQMAAVCVGYSEAYGFAAPGTVWDKQAVSMAYTIAPATTSDSVQDILVFSLIKHSGASQSYVSASPSTTSLTTALKTGSGMPSAHVGVYNGAAADRTDTWSVASSNGVGFQIAVNGAVAPVNSTLAEYNEGTLSAAGATVSNATDIEIVSEVGYDRVLLKSSATSKYFQWNLAIQGTYGVRFYAHLPSSWADTSADLFRASNGSDSEIYTRANLSGSGSPARMRWAQPGGAYFATTGPVLTQSATYRVELQSHTLSDTMRGAIWELGSDTPLYDSGWVGGNDGEGGAIFRFGILGTPPTGLLDMSISRVLVSSDVTEWIGRHSTDALIASSGVDVLGVWSGSSLTPAALLGVWSGTALEQADSLDVT